MRFRPDGSVTRGRWTAGLFLGVLWLLAAPGCASLARRSPPPGPGAVVLDGVPLREFGTDRCGAGALSEVLAYLGDPVPQDALDAALPKAEHGGVLSVDLLLAARERGFPAVLLPGDAGQVEDAVRRGSPPILMLQVADRPGRRADLFHYVVVDGFETDPPRARVHLGDGSARWIPWPRLDRAWEGGGRALLLVGPAGAAHEPELRQAVVLEEQGRLDEAVALLRQHLARSPDSALAWTNLGNVESRQDHREEAEIAYRRALDLAPGDRDASNNLAWLLLQEEGRLDEAETLARAAVAAGPPDAHVALDTLGQVLLARGECDGSREALRQALAAVPPSRAAERREVERSIEITTSVCGGAP